MNVREIKFRIWNTTYCKMSETFTLEQFAYDQDGEMGDCQLNLNDGVGENRKENILMQFTGLHDKNGREIYEGDILQEKDPYSAPKFEVRGIVKEQDGAFRVTFTYPKGLGTYLVYDRLEYEAEVIGNIHENPELLK